MADPLDDIVHDLTVKRRSHWDVLTPQKYEEELREWAEGNAVSKGVLHLRSEGQEVHAELIHYEVPGENPFHYLVVGTGENAEEIVVLRTSRDHNSLNFLYGMLRKVQKRAMETEGIRRLSIIYDLKKEAPTSPRTRGSLDEALENVPKSDPKPDKDRGFTVAVDPLETLYREMTCYHPSEMSSRVTKSSPVEWVVDMERISAGRIKEGMHVQNMGEFSVSYEGRAVQARLDIYILGDEEVEVLTVRSKLKKGQRGPMKTEYFKSPEIDDEDKRDDTWARHAFKRGRSNAWVYQSVPGFEYEDPSGTERRLGQLRETAIREIFNPD